MTIELSEIEKDLPGLPGADQTFIKYLLGLAKNLNNNLWSILIMLLKI